MVGKRVKVYRNLNNGLWSVLVASEPVVHVASIHLQNVLFHVNGKTQARIAAGAYREVHAWATGLVVERVPLSYETSIEVTYDPRIHRCFRTRLTDEAVYTTKFCSFETRSQDKPGCYISNIP